LRIGLNGGVERLHLGLRGGQAGQPVVGLRFVVAFVGAFHIGDDRRRGQTGLRFVIFYRYDAAVYCFGRISLPRVT